MPASSHAPPQVWDGQLREKRASLPMNWHVPKTVVASGRFAVTASEAEVCVWCLKEQRCIARHPYADSMPSVNGAPCSDAHQQCAILCCMSSSIRTLSL
jgi:hypothetical protein